MGVNSLPKTVTQQRRDCDLNPGPSAPESTTLTTWLPSHLEYVTGQYQRPCLSLMMYAVLAAWMDVTHWVPPFCAASLGSFEIDSSAWWSYMNLEVSYAKVPPKLSQFEFL